MVSSTHNSRQIFKTAQLARKRLNKGQVFTNTQQPAAPTVIPTARFSKEPSTFLFWKSPLTFGALELSSFENLAHEHVSNTYQAWFRSQLYWCKSGVTPLSLSYISVTEIWIRYHTGKSLPCFLCKGISNQLLDVLPLFSTFHVLKQFRTVNINQIMDMLFFILKNLFWCSSTMKLLSVEGFLLTNSTEWLFLQRLKNCQTNYLHFKNMNKAIKAFRKGNSLSNIS